MLNNLHDKTALITGASRGLGSHIAKTLWANGANLILVARSTDKLQQLRSQLQLLALSHQTIEIITTNLIHPLAITKLINQLEHQQIDILINNAAIQGPIGPLWENNWQEWEATLQVNLLAPIALCRSLVAQMLRRNAGKIINLSGGGATNGRPNFSAYAVAKAGLVRFTETLADEVKAFNIEVNCLAPGVMKSEMLAQILAAGKDKVGEKEYLSAMTQSDHTVIERAAELCVFLASTASKGISGKLISAKWDPWKKLPDYLEELKNSDIYTLRRIVPKDRGKNWDDVL